MFSKNKNISKVGMGWDGIQKWNGMELDAKNGMKQVEYCDEGFDNKTLFFYISFTFNSDSILYHYIVEFYRYIVQDILKKEYDFMGGFMGWFFSRF